MDEGGDNKKCKTGMISPRIGSMTRRVSTEVERKISQFILLNCTKWGTFRVQVHDLGHLSHPQAALNGSHHWHDCCANLP